MVLLVGSNEMSGSVNAVGKTATWDSVELWTNLYILYAEYTKGWFLFASDTRETGQLCVQGLSRNASAVNWTRITMRCDYNSVIENMVFMPQWIVFVNSSFWWFFSICFLIFKKNNYVRFRRLKKSAHNRDRLRLGVDGHTICHVWNISRSYVSFGKIYVPRKNFWDASATLSEIRLERIA
jgi:hypothetical protein